MSQAPSEAATERDLELVEDSLSALTFESDTETKLKRKASRKPPKSPKSPYTSSTCLHPKKAGFLRSFKGKESKHFEIPLVKSSRQLWRESLKQGTWVNQMKSDLDIDPVGSTFPSNTPEYLKEALGMKKPKQARSASRGYIPGTPDYKEKEDMYDEIIELKKTIQTQKREGDRMKTKLRRLEEDNNRKDKQIEQLLESSRGSEFSWIRAEPKSDNCVMISGLKQKILRLEQQCKEKENTINKLQTEVKSTNMEEMRIALQTSYEEIQRLQTLLAKPKTVQRKSLPESQQQKVLNAAVLQLSRILKDVQDENWKLKADLDHALSSSPVSSKVKNCIESSRQRLEQQISELNKQLDEVWNNRLQHSETSTSPLLTSSYSAQLDQPFAKEAGPSEECEQLRRVVKKLKGQRGAFQNQLAVKEEEIQKLTEKVKELEEKQEANRREAGMDVTKLLDQDQQELCTGGQQSHPTCMLSPRGLHLGSSPPCSPEHHSKDQAARIIQRQWKTFRSKNEEDALNEMAVVLQSAFRGHLARQKLLARDQQSLNSPTIPSAGNKNPDLSCGPSSLQMAADCGAEEEVVRLIQSVFRAHLTRTQLEERTLNFSPESEKASPAVSSREEKAAWSTFKYAPLVFTSAVPAMSSQDQLQPCPSLPADEVLSDDSDDIITVSPAAVTKKSPFDFGGYLSHSLLRS